MFIVKSQYQPRRLAKGAEKIYDYVTCVLNQPKCEKNKQCQCVNFRPFPSKLKLLKHSTWLLGCGQLF